MTFQVNGKVCGTCSNAIRFIDKQVSLWQGKHDASDVAKPKIKKTKFQTYETGQDVKVYDIVEHKLIEMTIILQLEEPNKWLFHVPLATTLTVIYGDTVSHDDVRIEPELLHQNLFRDNDKIIEPHVDLEDDSNEFCPRLTNETLKNIKLVI